MLAKKNSISVLFAFVKGKYYYSKIQIGRLEPKDDGNDDNENV